MTASREPNDHLSRLESLVDELNKDLPDEHRVRTCMKAAGIPYSADPISRMSSVLSALERVRDTRRRPQKAQEKEQV